MEKLSNQARCKYTQNRAKKIFLAIFSPCKTATYGEAV